MEAIEDMPQQNNRANWEQGKCGFLKLKQWGNPRVVTVISEGQSVWGWRDPGGASQGNGWRLFNRMPLWIKYLEIK